MRILTFLSCLFFANVILAQPEYGLHFQKHLPQSAINVNPGIFTDHKVNVTLPGVQGGFMNSSFQWSDALTRSRGEYDLDLEPAIREMENTGNFIRSSVSASALGLTFRIKDNYQFTFFHNTHVDFQLTYPKTLPALIWRGNGAFVGEQVEVAPQINLLGYNEYGMGFATRANDKIIVGVNLKYVNGVMGINTEKANTILTTDAEFYQLTFENDIRIQTAGLTDIFDGDEDDILADTDPSYFVIGGSRGFSVDMGLSYQVNDKLELQMAIQDFGYISWDQHVLEQTSLGTFEYNGEIVRPFTDDNDEFDFDEVRDSISDIFEFNAREKVFLSNFPLRVFASGSYQLDPTLSLGASLHFENYADAGTTNTVIGFHAQKLFGKVFYLGGVAGFHNESFAFLGANGTLQLGPVQLYLMTDNLITLIDPTFGRFTNVRTGINLSFGRKNKKKEEVEEEAEPANNYFN